MVTLRKTLLRVLWILPALALGYLGSQQFLDGLAVNAAIPVPVYMIIQIKMPQAAYVDAMIALGKANEMNGEAKIAHAEAALRSGASPGSEISDLTQGLMNQPASTRGWTLLSEAQTPVDKGKAAQALSMALLLAPSDYFLVGPKTLAAASLWPELGSASRALALEQTRILWSEPNLREELRVLLSSRAGARLVARAFADSPNDVRAMNRWMTLDRLNAATAP